MAQPALTQQIRKMEELLGVRLIERAGRGIRITASGERLYERAVSLLRYEAETRIEVSDIKEGRTGILRIGVNTLSAGRLTGWVQEMKRRHPRITLQIHQGESGVLIDRLKDHAIDVALVRLPIEAQGVTIEWMEEEPFYQVHHPEFPGRRRHYSESGRTGSLSNAQPAVRRRLAGNVFRRPDIDWTRPVRTSRDTVTGKYASRARHDGTCSGTVTGRDEYDGSCLVDGRRAIRLNATISDNCSRTRINC